MPVSAERPETDRLKSGDARERIVFHVAEI